MVFYKFFRSFQKNFSWSFFFGKKHFLQKLKNYKSEKDKNHELFEKTILFETYDTASVYRKKLHDEQAATMGQRVCQRGTVNGSATGTAMKASTNVPDKQQEKNEWRDICLEQKFKNDATQTKTLIRVKIENCWQKNIMNWKRF